MYQKRWQKNVLSKPGRALDLTPKITTAAVSKNSKQNLPTLPELITFKKTQERAFTEVNLYKLCYINGAKNR